MCASQMFMSSSLASVIVQFVGGFCWISASSFGRTVSFLLRTQRMLLPCLHDPLVARHDGSVVLCGGIKLAAEG